MPEPVVMMLATSVWPPLSLPLPDMRSIRKIAPAGLRLKADVSVVLAASESRARGSHSTVRLEHITDDACSRFQKDNTDFRLVTTYLGQGTQWARVENRALGQIQTLDRFDVGMFLGQRSRRSDILVDHQIAWALEMFGHSRSIWFRRVFPGQP